MAERPTPARLYPAWELSPPWSTPMTQQEQEGLAQTALLSGSGDTDRAVTSLLAQFAGLYVQNLRASRA